MAIVNRDLSPSQQMAQFNVTANLTVGASAGSDHCVALLPFPGTLKQIAIAAASISGAPSVSAGVRRFTSAGSTTIAFVGATIAPVAYGISGYATQVLSVTSFALQAGDAVVITAAFAGGNVSANSTAVSVIVQATQDIKSYFGTAY